MTMTRTVAQVLRDSVSVRLHGGGRYTVNVTADYDDDTSDCA